jgi:hypothetical protein
MFNVESEKDMKHYKNLFIRIEKKKKIILKIKCCINMY